MEPGGQGSFQAVKLQRPARTTVCSHSTRDMAATRSIKAKLDPNDAKHECLSSWEQWLTIVGPHPPGLPVRADSKGVTGTFFVRTDSKGLREIGWWPSRIAVNE